MTRLKYLSLILPLILFSFNGCTGKKVRRSRKMSKVTADVAVPSPVDRTGNLVTA